MARLRATKADRDQSAWAAALSRLESASRTQENTMPHIIEAVTAGATVGEICGLWRRVFGEYKEVMAV
jgi:methylmalonyl-CoA mutase N-terminal domain/subunit